MVADIAIDDSQIDETGLLHCRCVLCIVRRDEDAIPKPAWRKSLLISAKSVLGQLVVVATIHLLLTEGQEEGFAPPSTSCGSPPNC